jgi:hypothetical protein
MRTHRDLEPSVGQRCPQRADFRGVSGRGHSLALASWTAAVLCRFVVHASLSEKRQGTGAVQNLAGGSCCRQGKCRSGRGISRFGAGFSVLRAISGPVFRSNGSSPLRWSGTVGSR